MTKKPSETNSSAFSAGDSLALKGVAIVIMMFHHCFMEPERFAGYTVDFFPFTQALVTNISLTLKICVSIFAFISGYGLYLSAKTKCTDEKGAESWVVSRLLKTMSGFWFVYLLSLIVTQLYAGYPQSVYCGEGWTRGLFYALMDFLGLANIMGTPSLLATWWYMGAAIIFIVLVPVMMKWSEKFGSVSLIIVTVVGVRFACGGYPGGTNAFSFVFPLLFGLLFAKHDLFQKLDQLHICKNKYLNSALTFIGMGLLVVACVHTYLRLPHYEYWEFHFGIYPVIFICFCRKYLLRIPVLDKVLAYFGKHSMNIFLIHTFLRHTFFGDFIYGFGHFLLIAGVLFCLSLGISVLVIEPLKKLLRYDRLMEALITKLCAPRHP